MDKQLLTISIKNYCHELGFQLVGITSAAKVEDYYFYRSWVDEGFAASMDYLKRNLEKREDPELLLPGTKSVICVGLNYYTAFEQQEYKVAKYALGDDYHTFLKEKLQKLFEYIKTIAPEVEGRPYVDTAPILERSLAKRAGLGWIGKNSMLINPQKGSYFLLGELFINLELNYDSPIKDHCGSCNRCMRACPTAAIIAPGKIDSNLCISYLTIESKEEIPETLTGRLENNIFGCDICQDVCPWNKKFAEPSELEEVKPRQWLKNSSVLDLLKWQQENFSGNLKNSPIKRSKLKGFLRNIIAMTGKNQSIRMFYKKKLHQLLQEMSESEEPLIKNQAKIALKGFSNEQE